MRGRHDGDAADVRLVSLTQELLLCLADFMRTQPELFVGTVSGRRRDYVRA
jgi:hypothetical protein